MAASARSLLVELGTEELPPRALAGLGRCFGEELTSALEAAQLIADGGSESRWFATPRRLAVWIAAVRQRQPDREIQRRGPAVAAAIAADGAPTAAARGFARSCGVEVDALDRLVTGQGEWLVYREKQTGQSARELVPAAVESALARLPVPKPMRWGTGTEEFIRPVHWLVMLHGRTIIKARVLSVGAGRITRGHRFHHPDGVSLRDADAYESGLLEAKVVADFTSRRDRIRQQAERLCHSLGARPRIDSALLDEVTGLVEWPRAVRGNFDKRFLDLPAEVLVSAMQHHQKFFPVTGPRGGLRPHFIATCNIQSKAPNRVRRGFERVLRARLADAEFFWRTDRDTALADRRADLAGVTFHHKLGSMEQKSNRLERLAGGIARWLRTDPDLPRRAAALAKNDLVTDMVGEFPELQGIMGRYYALHDGEAPAVAEAIAQHYLPRFAGDDLPRDLVGRIVAVADKADTVVGLYAAGEIPTGDRDPFALRRAALGILRISIEGELDLDLTQVVETAAAGYAADGLQVSADATSAVMEFMFDRLHSYYQSSGFAADELAAVLECRPTRPLDFDARLRAVAAFRRSPSGRSLAAANKRIRNILRRSADPIPDRFTADLFQEPGERSLAASLVAVASDVWPLTTSRRYTEALEVMADFREPIDRFFDEVLVMADDTEVRTNRLALLDHVSRLFLAVADVSKLQTEGTVP